MNYAPVIIPTLNRYKHLRRCIESLEKNQACVYTDLYISLDFPPSDKYRVGYNETKKYLKELCNQNMFKNVFVFEQIENLGPTANAYFLVKKVTEKSDVWLYSEDDVEYSSNYLEYMNKCLTRFEADPSITSICGCSDFLLDIDEGNIYKDFIFCPYGVGHWKNKYDEVMVNCTNVLFSKKNCSFNSVYALSKANETLFCRYVDAILCGNSLPEWADNEILMTDCIRGLYNYFTDSYCIHPTKSKSHTYGNDGSGVNMKATNIDPNVSVPLDDSENFNLEYHQDGFTRHEILEQLDRAHSIIYKMKYHDVMKSWVKYFIFLINKKDRIKTINFLIKMKALRKYVK